MASLPNLLHFAEPDNDNMEEEPNLMAVVAPSESQQYNSCDDWRVAIRTKQSSNITPEMRERIRAKAVRQKRRGKKVKRAKMYQKCASLNKRAWGQGNQKYLNTRNYESVESSAVQMRSVQEVYQNMDAWRNDDEEAECAMENMLDEMEAVQLADDVQVDDNSMDALLRQLRREPTDDEETQAKFALYENFLATVEASRKATYDFWDDCREEFEENAASSQNAVAQVEADLRAIDGEDNLGIVFMENRWFVYDMIVQADKNNETLKKALHNIEIKLELLQKEDDDCPFCLENLAEAQLPFVTLACCHKACTECWTHWQELKGRNAFCPLCRNEDFLESIMS